MSAWLLQNAQIIDGSKRAAFMADVRIENGRIVAIGNALPTLQAQSFDCAGLVLCPGFIDSHTHDDAQLLRNPGMAAKLSQGVTTVIAGNCGLSLVPLVTRTPPPPLDLLHTDEFAYASIADYRAAIARACPSINVATLIGHSSLRVHAMHDLERPANDQEIAAMCQALERAMQQGALGLSSGLFYATAQAADLKEMQALVRVVGRYGGIYATHLRSEMDAIIDAMHEAASTARTGPATWVLSHHKCAGPANWGRSIETLALLESLAQHQEIAIDAYPYAGWFNPAARRPGRWPNRDSHHPAATTAPRMRRANVERHAQQWQMSEQEACRKLSPGGACYFSDARRRCPAHPQSPSYHDRLRRVAPR